MSVIDDLSTHMENVARDVFPIYEESATVASLIKNRGETQEVSRYLYRIPFEATPPGAFGKYSANASAMGIGYSSIFNHLTNGYFYARMAFRLTQEQLNVTSGGRKSVINIFNRTLERGMGSMDVMKDISLHTDGTGQLTNASSAAPALNQLTFNGTTDQLKSNKIREGLSIEVWNSAGSTRRTGFTAPLFIRSINHSTHVVTFNQNVTDAVSTDLLAFEGMDTYGPATLTSFNSGWPTAPESQVASGLGGDTFRHGIYYANDNTPANFFFGIQKSAEPQLLPVHVDANTNALNFAHVYSLLEQLIQRRDSQENSTLRGLVGIAHTRQRRQVFELGTAIANVFLTGDNEFGKNANLLPSNVGYDEAFNFGPFQCVISKRQRLDRFDFINPDKWGRAEALPLGFYDIGGKRFFEARDGSTGQVASAMDWYLVDAFDWYTRDPGCQGYIDNLGVPALS